MILFFFVNSSQTFAKIIPGFFFHSNKDGEHHVDIDKTKDIVFTIVFWQAVTSTVLAIPFILFFKGKPLHPPTPSSLLPRKSFVESIKILLKNKNYIILFIVFSLIEGS